MSNEVARIRASSINISCPVRINPAPESVGKRVSTKSMSNLIRHVGRGSPDRKCHASSVKRAGWHPYELAQDM
jgi:hypothetical protein